MASLILGITTLFLLRRPDAVSATGALVGGTIPFSEHGIAESFDGADSVYATDVDGDGDMDILSAASIADDVAWWENDGGESFTEHTIAGDFDGAYGVYAADVDGDGDVDVLGAASLADDITWWENDGDESFTEHTIASFFDGAYCVYATDVDGDGDVDVLGAAVHADDITWWENDGDESFTEHIIAGTFNGARFVYATDVDGDGDVDVLGAGYYADDITWWENDGDESFTEHTIAGFFDGAYSVYATDVDGDGDVDVLGAAVHADDVTWWENDGDESFTEHTIAGAFDGATSVYAADVDGDGDPDALGAAYHGDDIVWWENDGNGGFTGHTIASRFDGARSVYAADVDGDSDVDVLGAAYDAGAITWWEQRPLPSPTVASFPFYDGFESGATGTDWTTYTTYEGRVRVSSSYPYSGTYSLLLDDFDSNQTFSYAAAVLTIDLSGQSDVDLDFWWREFNDESDPDDGVFISDDDGPSWYRILSFNGGTSAWRREVIDIDAEVITHGLSLNDHFKIKFQFYDDDAISIDGYAIDEVRIRTSVNPTLSWTGEMNYVSDGLHPMTGGPSDDYVYRVRYADGDGDPPAYVRVHIEEGGTEIAGSPFTMTCESGDYTAGVNCGHTQSGLATGLDYTYTFDAQDDRGRPAVPPPELSGPYVTGFSGNISGTLDLAGSPYVASGDLTVAAGDVLTIQPGVEVHFAGSFGLTVLGDVLANGTAGAPITFTSFLTPAQPGDWLGIRFRNSGDNDRLSHVRVEFAETGIEVEADDGTASPTVEHSVIRDNEHTGISIVADGDTQSAYASPQILSSTIAYNGDDGVSVVGQGGSDEYLEGHASPTIRNNAISNNGGRGVYFYGEGGGAPDAHGKADGYIVRNAITDNGSYGVECYGYGGSAECYPSSCAEGLASPDIIGNVISDNGSTGVFVRGRGRSSGEVRNIGYASPLVVNNSIVNNDGHGVHAYAIESRDRTHPKVVNNTIVGNTFAGVQSMEEVWSSFDIRNNLIVSNTTGLAAYEGETPDVGCNGFWGNETDFSNYPATYGVIAATNANGDPSDLHYDIFLAPLFVDPLAGDYHLRSNSPAIDAGCVQPYVPDNDMDGHGRPAGARYDIGADEYPIVGLVGISPDVGGNLGPVQITNLAGSNFRPGATVKLSKAGEPDVVAANVTVVSDSRITCDFDLTDVAIGQWHVVVTNPDGYSATLVAAFTVTPAALEVTKRAEPTEVQAGERLTYTLRVTNTGRVDLHATVTDTLPIQVRPGGVLTWTPVITAPDSVWEQTVVVTVELSYAGPLTNVVQVISEEGASGVYTETSQAEISPALEISKHAQPDAVRAGEQLTYTLRVTNTGNADLHATVTDTLPAQVTPGGALTWTPVITTPGGVWEETVAVTVEMGYAGPLTNVVQVATEEGASGVYTETSQAESFPALEISKRARPDVVRAGEQLTYTLKVTNTGSLDLHATVTDTLPAGVTPGGVLMWTPVITAPGGVWEETVVVTAEMGYAGPLTNVVQVTTEEGASGVYTETSQAEISPALEVSKLAEPDVVQAGEQLTYTLRVTNTGNVDLHATVTDTLPTQLTPGGVLTWTPVITAPGGVWKQTVVVTVEVGYAGQLTNVVQVATEEGASGVYTETSQAEISPALEVSKRAEPDPVQAGEGLTYTLRVTNTGNVDLHATVTDTLPTQVTPGEVLTWTPVITAPGCVWQQTVVVTVGMGYEGSLTNVVQVATEEGASGVYTETSQAQILPAALEVSKQAQPEPVQAGEQLTYTVRVTNTGAVDLHATVTDTLPTQVTPGGVITWTPVITAPDSVWEQTVVVTVELSYAGPLTNVVQVATEEGASGVYTETSQAEISPALEVSKHAQPDLVQAGEQLTYTLRVTNTGNADLHATVTDTLPAQVTPGEVLTWTPVITAPDGVWEQTVVVTVEMGYAGPLTNVVQVATEEGASGVYTETSYAQILPTALEVSKQAQPDPVQAGEQLTYTLRVTNTGAVDLHATVTDTLPGQVTPGGMLTWTPVITAPDGVWEETVVVTVEMGYAGPLTNVVQVATEEGASGVYIKTSQAEISPALEVSKGAEPDVVQAGEQLTYTLRVTNTGNADLHATVTDTLPAQVTPGGVLTWTPVITAPDGVWEQTVVVTVEMGYAGPLTNVVQVATEEGASGVYTETSQAEISPALEVSKHAQPDVVQAGEQLIYTLRVTNTGNVDLHATVTDTLPAQVTPGGVLKWTPVITAPDGVWEQTVAVTVEMSYAGPLTNVVQVATEEGASGVYTETSQAEVSPALEVSKQAQPDPVQAGEKLTYTLRVTNMGNADLHATITDTLPAQVTPGGVLTWTPVITAPDGVWEQTVVVTVEMGYAGALTNVVQATTEEGASGVYTETSQTRILPALLLSKRAEPDRVRAGEPLTYTLRVANTGNVDLHATVTDTLPTQVSPSGVLTWTPVITAPGGVWKQTVVVTVEIGYEGTLTNVVQATTEEGANGFFIETSRAENFPALEVSKRAESDSVQPGERLTYSLRVTNTGSIDLHATVTDTLPAGVTPGGVLTWTPVITAPDGVWERTVFVTVKRAYLGTLTNVVQVTTEEGASGEDIETTAVLSAHRVYLPLLLRGQ
jgi:uncharacterized repeat protein (TIGR01451 family)